MPQLPSTNDRYRHGCFIATENAANVHNAVARIDAARKAGHPLAAEEIEEKTASDFAPRLRPRRRP